MYSQCICSMIRFAIVGQHLVVDINVHIRITSIVYSMHVHVCVGCVCTFPCFCLERVLRVAKCKQKLSSCQYFLPPEI